MSNEGGVSRSVPADVLHPARRASFVENDREFQLNRASQGAVAMVVVRRQSNFRGWSTVEIRPEAEAVRTLSEMSPLFSL